MITIKNKKEIENMRISCRIIKEVKNILWEKLVEGVTALELDSIAEKEIIKRGAKPAFKGYMGFKYSLCISFNEEMIHGIPSKRKVKKGDIVKIDMGCVYNEMYSDTAFTKGFGDLSKRDKELIKVAKDSFFVGFDVIKPGIKVGDISAAIGKYVKKHNFYVPTSFAGHGIGHQLHEDPYIFNDGIPGTGPTLKEGMVICIEPMILQKSNDVIIGKDGWTVISSNKKNTAHYEQTVLITKNGAEILTEDN